VERAEGEKLGFGLRYTVFPFLLEATVLLLNGGSCNTRVTKQRIAVFLNKDNGWLNNAIFLTHGSGKH
jgi:hypothetical protein